MTTRVLVTGADGLIGHHLVTYLRERGHWVSDNSRLREVLGWESGIDLAQGPALTYPWIEGRVHRRVGTGA